MRCCNYPALLVLVLLGAILIGCSSQPAAVENSGMTTSSDESQSLPPTWTQTPTSISKPLATETPTAYPKELDALVKPYFDKGMEASNAGDCDEALTHFNKTLES